MKKKPIEHEIPQMFNLRIIRMNVRRKHDTVEMVFYTYFNYRGSKRGTIQIPSNSKSPREYAKRIILDDCPEARFYR